MTKRALFVFAFFSFASGADFAPSVWEQLEHHSLPTVEAKVTDIEVLNDKVLVTFTTKEGSTETAKLCNDFELNNLNNDNFRSEEQRAAFFRERMIDLREAKNSREMVKLLYKGPWGPCLMSVKSVSHAKTARAD